jgi:hypothetical protein
MRVVCLSLCSALHQSRQPSRKTCFRGMCAMGQRAQLFKPRLVATSVGLLRCLGFERTDHACWVTQSGIVNCSDALIFIASQQEAPPTAAPLPALPHHHKRRQAARRTHHALGLDERRTRQDTGQQWPMSLASVQLPPSLPAIHLRDRLTRSRHQVQHVLGVFPIGALRADLCTGLFAGECAS